LKKNKKAKIKRHKKKSLSWEFFGDISLGMKNKTTVLV
jgi:hypothetical protein